MPSISEANSQKIKNMSVVCALLVVTIHVGWPKDEVCFTWFVNELVQHGVARIAVPFFFVVSGFFISAHFSERGWWKVETAKRIYSLVVPFFLWCGIAFLLISPLSIVADLMAHRPFGTNLPVSDGRWLMAIGLDLSVCPNLIPLWYVRCLFLFVLLSPLFKFGLYSKVSGKPTFPTSGNGARRLTPLASGKTGCKHANDRPSWAFGGPGAVFTCSQPCAAGESRPRCKQAA